MPSNEDAILAQLKLQFIIIFFHSPSFSFFFVSEYTLSFYLRACISRISLRSNFIWFVSLFTSQITTATTKILFTIFLWRLLTRNIHIPRTRNKTWNSSSRKQQPHHHQVCEEFFFAAISAGSSSRTSCCLYCCCFWVISHWLDPIRR